MHGALKTQIVYSDVKESFFNCQCINAFKQPITRSFQKPHKKLCLGGNLELVVDNGAQPTADTEFAPPLNFFTDSVCDLKPSPLPSSPFLPFHCGYGENS